MAKTESNNDLDIYSQTLSNFINKKKKAKRERNKNIDF